MVNDYFDRDAIVKLLESLGHRIIIVPNTYGSGGQVVVITGYNKGEEQIITYTHGSLE